MRGSVSAVTVAAVLAATLAPVGSPRAGELTGQGSGRSWVSAECIQPVAPDVDKTDAQALNASIIRYNRFVAAVDQYNRCLRTEADADILRLRNVINGDVEALQKAAIAATEAVREAVAQPRDPSEVPAGGVQ